MAAGLLLAFDEKITGRWSKKNEMQGGFLHMLQVIHASISFSAGFRLIFCRIPCKIKKAAYRAADNISTVLAIRRHRRWDGNRSMEYMEHSNDLIAKIQSMMGEFSKGQKLIARYIIENYDKAAFMTASKLGSTVGVSESTVVRFSTELGYDGYPKLQKALQELIRIKLTAVQRIEVTNNRIGDQDILRTVMMSDIEKLRLTLEDIKRDDFNAVVDAILGAKKIYILGVRSSAALTSFLGFYFNLMFENVRLVHTTSVSEMFEQILKVTPEDVVIGISFPRYSSRTVKALQYAHDRGAQVVAITDSMFSPLVANATHCLIARSDMASFVDSLVAPLSVINALIVALGMKKKKETYDTFEHLEKIWDEYGVYEKYNEK